MYRERSTGLAHRQPFIQVRSWHDLPYQCLLECSLRQWSGLCTLTCWHSHKAVAVLRHFKDEIIFSTFSSQILSTGWEDCCSSYILQLANLKSLFLEFLLKSSRNIQKSKDSKLFTYCVHLPLPARPDLFPCIWTGSAACFSHSRQWPEAGVELWLCYMGLRALRMLPLLAVGEAVGPDAWEAASLPGKQPACRVG